MRGGHRSLCGDDGHTRRHDPTHRIPPPAGGVVLAGLPVGMVTPLGNPVEGTQVMEPVYSTIAALHGWHPDLVGPWIPIPPW